jgi:hypothetical protein
VEPPKVVENEERGGRKKGGKKETRRIEKYGFHMVLRHLFATFITTKMKENNKELLYS